MVSTQETLHRAPYCIPSISTLWSSSIYVRIPHCFKRHPTWLIMILGIRAHSIRFQLTVQIVSTYFYVLSIQGTQLLLRNAQTANWYLNLNVLGYRIRYKKKFMCIRSTQKNMRIYNYTWTKFHFHACARRGYVIYIVILKVLFITN